MANQTADRALRILVINPNSSQDLTTAIDRDMARLRIVGGPEIMVDYLRDGPPGLVTQQDADSVILPLASHIETSDADAFVIACFRDPGLQSAREAAGIRPVFGIAESGILAALGRGERFGIMALTAQSVLRQQGLVRQMGLFDRYAGSVPAELAPTDTGDDVRDRLIQAGRTLVTGHGADVLIIGHTGLGRHVEALTQTLGCPVLEPTQQAVAAAIERLMLA